MDFACIGSLTISYPFNSIFPSVGLRRPVIIFMAVVFPAAFGPRSPKTSPLSTWRLSPFTAHLPLKDLLTLSRTIINFILQFYGFYWKGKQMSQAGTAYCRICGILIDKYLKNCEKIIRKMGREWVEVLITYDRLEAEIIKDLLESGGIPVVLRSSKMISFPVNVGKIGEIKILVKKGDKETAEKVIKIGNDCNPMTE